MNASTSSAPRLPLSLFGISFGLAGLAGLWTEAADLLHLPGALPDTFWVIAAAAWGVTLVRYLIRARSARTVIDDLRRPVLGPFASLVPIVATIFGERIYTDLPHLGQTWVLLTTTLSFTFGAWFITQLMTREREIDNLHSGYFLPTVAAGLISAQALATVGYPTLSIGAYGTGILFWLLFGAVTLHRLAFRPQTPATLIPTYAIFSAPPAVAGNAWFAITGNPENLDLIQQTLLGTFLLLIAIQLLLTPTYLKAPFTLGFWALTFTTAASARYAIHLIDILNVPGAAIGEWTVTILATGIIGAIAAASIRLVIRTRSEQKHPGREAPHPTRSRVDATAR